MNRYSASRALTLVTAAAAALVALAGCAQHTRTEPISEISVRALYESLSADPDAIFVDVRTPQEWQGQRAQGVTHFIEYDQIGGRHQELGASKSRTIYLICRSGRRSMIAAQTLRDLGYEHTVNVSGGTNAWVAEGLPTESGSPPTDQP
ncbi:MAG TPA: rhodanese-like domain-containing protein [candidate division Zixibacteria bacterium]|nr:rhodanese-like domain-containing protein [candidate division Zixibacteria bacterium]